MCCTLCLYGGMHLDGVTFMGMLHNVSKHACHVHYMQSSLCNEFPAWESAADFCSCQEPIHPYIGVYQWLWSSFCDDYITDNAVCQ